jgi:hypothetical protein
MKRTLRVGQSICLPIFTGGAYRRLKMEIFSRTTAFVEASPTTDKAVFIRLFVLPV